MIENKYIPYILILSITCLLIAFMLVEFRNVPSQTSVPDSPVVENEHVAEPTRSEESDQALPQVQSNKTEVESDNTKPSSEQIRSVQPDPVSVTLSFPSSPAEHYTPHVFDYLSPDQEITLINPETQEALPATVESVSDRINGETTIVAGRLNISEGQNTHFTLVNDPEITTLTLRPGSGAVFQVRVDNASGEQIEIEKTTEGDQTHNSSDQEIEPEQNEDNGDPESTVELSEEEVQKFIPSPSSSRESFRNIQN